MVMPSVVGRGIAAVILWLALFVGQPAAATTTASLDRDTIQHGETVHLVVESDQPTATPDWAGLEADFAVLGTSSSHNIALSGGVQTTTRRWVVELEPRAVGTFTIPALALGQETTEPLLLTVKPPPPADTAGRDFWLEVTTDLKSAYVQQMITLTARLFLSLDITSGSLTEPSAANLEITRLGDDVQYDSQRGGRTYRVVERKYALFPQASGALMIPPLQFQGRTRSNSSRLRQGRRIRAQSDALRLQIAPPNPQFPGRVWLPARNITITEQPIADPSLTAGTPYTWQLKVTADGARAEQLPDLNFPTTDNLRQYPDRVARENQLANQSLIGVLAQNVALIPQAEGMVTIPEIRIHWWDVINDEARVAILPARTLEVTAASLTAPTGVATPQPELTAAIEQRQRATADAARWRWLALLLAVLWVATLGLLTLKLRADRRQARASARPAETLAVNSARLLEQLTRACRRNDATAAYHGLNQWRRHHYPERTVEDWLATLPQGELRAAIGELENNLYGPAAHPTTGQWSGRRLEQALHQLPTLDAPSGAAPDNALTELYSFQMTDSR